MLKLLLKIRPYLLILLIILANDFLVQQSLMFHIFALTFLIFFYYWYRKMTLFLQLKMKQFEQANMLNAEMRHNQICKLPVIWSNRLCYINPPFLEACKNGDLDLIKALIEQGNINIQETNIFGEGAIFLATFNLLKSPKNKDASCIWYLQQLGCSVNVKNKDGYAPIHLAAFKGHCRLIAWLIKKGANVNIDPSPAGLALIRGHKKAAAIILTCQYKIPIENLVKTD